MSEELQVSACHGRLVAGVTHMSPACACVLCRLVLAGVLTSGVWVQCLASLACFHG